MRHANPPCSYGSDFILRPAELHIQKQMPMRKYIPDKTMNNKNRHNTTCCQQTFMVSYSISFQIFLFKPSCFSVQKLAGAMNNASYEQDDTILLLSH